MDLKGNCFCGEAKFSVTKGEIVVSCLCHCTICQRLRGSPNVHYVAFPPSAVTLPDSKAVLTSNSSKLVTQFVCNKCHGFVLKKVKTNDDPASGFIAIPSVNFARGEGNQIEQFEQMKPSCHIFYDTALFPVNDSLPKYKQGPGSELV